MGSHGRWDDYDIAFMVTMIIKQGRFKCIECMNNNDKLYDVPTYNMKILKYDPFLTSNWRRLPHPIEEQPNQSEGPWCTWCHELSLHIHLRLLLWIGTRRNVLLRHHEMEDMECDLWVDTMFFPQQWDEFHLRVWSWLKGKLPQGHV